MAIITKTELRSQAITAGLTRDVKAAIRSGTAYQKFSAVTSVFLSHSHHDKEWVEAATVILENLGIKVYVDWEDEAMPSHTNLETASRIKRKIGQENDKFIFLATNTSIASKWCNWEIGIGDVYKFDKKKIAIFPVKENDGAWAGNEYLKLYPHIGYNTILKDFLVSYPEGGTDYLSIWLKK